MKRGSHVRDLDGVVHVVEHEMQGNVILCCAPSLDNKHWTSPWSVEETDQPADCIRCLAQEEELHHGAG